MVGGRLGQRPAGVSPPRADLPPPCADWRVWGQSVVQTHLGWDRTTPRGGQCRRIPEAPARQLVRLSARRSQSRRGEFRPPARGVPHFLGDYSPCRALRYRGITNETPVLPEILGPSTHPRALKPLPGTIPGRGLPNGLYSRSTIPDIAARRNRAPGPRRRARALPDSPRRGGSIMLPLLCRRQTPMHRRGKRRAASPAFRRSIAVRYGRIRPVSLRARF